MMTQKILIMGLPGAGKTYFANILKRWIEGVVLSDKTFSVEWFNADTIRQMYNDWDFSVEGRIRQSVRMFSLAEQSRTDYVICDFVAPLQAMRDNFKADWTIWIDTIQTSRFEDTNSIFVPPTEYDFRITEQNAEWWAQYVGIRILKNERNRAML